jgi:hypothetical protein
VAAVHECECDVCQAGADQGVIEHHRHINLVLSRLAEAERRWYVASLSSGPAAPSDGLLAQISGLSDKTIQRGGQELEHGLKDTGAGRQRQAGGGRKPAEKKIRR